jgi:hypothetical protein
VHGPERPPEGLGRAVAVADGDREQVVVADEVRRGHGHPTPPHVLRHRHAGQRREHPARVVPRRPHRPGELVDVQVVGEAALDLVDEAVEHVDHGSSLR